MIKTLSLISFGLLALAIPQSWADDWAELGSQPVYFAHGDANTETVTISEVKNPPARDGATSPAEQPLQLVPIASIHVTREIGTALSFGIIFSTDAKYDLVKDSKDSLSSTLVALLLGFTEYQASGPSAQVDVGVNGIKVSAGYTTVQGTNILWVIPVEAMGLSIKGSAVYQWADSHSAIGFGKAGQVYVGPELDMMLRYVRVSVGLLRRVSGPDVGSPWQISAGVGIGL